MEYIVIPIEKLNEVSQEQLDTLHLSPRLNISGTKAILKCSHFEILFEADMTYREELDEMGNVVQIPVYPYPTYEGESLTELLQSEEWTPTEIDNG